MGPEDEIDGSTVRNKEQQQGGREASQAAEVEVEGEPTGPVPGLPSIATCLLALLFALIPTLPAQEPLPELEIAEVVSNQGSIPVKIVGGRLVAAVELSTIHRRITANLFIDFETSCGLRLHDSAAASMKTEDEFGGTTPITIHFPEFAIEVARREQGPQDEYAEFTRLHSEEINEDALVGSIGAKILSRYRVTFNLHEGRMELALPEDGAEVADEEPVEAPGEEELEVAITTTKDIVWLPIQLGDGKVRAMAVSTTSFDSLVDGEWCKHRGVPGGDVSPLNLGELDLSSFVAFRPSAIPYKNPDGAIGVMGLNMLRHLHLTIDRNNKTAVCRVTAPPNFPVADREYFNAFVAEDADLLEAWLEKYPAERLSPEAAQHLLAYRLDENAGPEQIEQAISRLRVTWRDDMVSTQALDLMNKLLETGHPLQAVFAGELGIEGGRKDRYPNSVHQLHASMGEILLDHDEDKRAWRHLLSAAFGVPDDGRVNLNLGRFYEKQERYNRALSRYVQAVIKVETGEPALKGLDRVQRKMGDTKPLSVDTIAPLIAGKTYNYAAATRFRPKPDEETKRVSLVEFFTNAQYKKPGKEEGAIGGALSNEGVMTYFPRQRVAMLTYHVAHPQLPLDSLVNEFAQHTAEFYGVPPTVQLVNGSWSFPGEGHRSDAEALFNEGRDVIRRSLKEKSDFQLELTSAIEDDDIVGSLKVTNLSPGDTPKKPPTVQIVLAERGVLYPSKSKIVIQRMVVRAALTNQFDGIPFEPKDGQMIIPFSRSMTDIIWRNIGHMKTLESKEAGMAQTFAAEMDPRQLTVVAFVRDGDSKKILQAIQIDPTLPPEDEPGTSE